MLNYSTYVFCSVPQRAVADLGLQMREGGGHPDPKGGGPVSKKIFFILLGLSLV